MFNNNSESNINIAHDANGVVGQNISGNITQYFISHESKASIHNRKLVTFSPYVGLEKFQTKDKEKFFGRQAWITKLNQHLKQKNVLLLLGASGSGKSSLIRAGLITNLEDNWGDFINLTFEPDIDVFKSLYSSLQSNIYKQSELDIALGDNNLVQVVKKLKRDSRWLIFIDQFEELFTRTRKPERDNFVASLMQLIEEQDNSVKIVLTMRADFLDKFSPYPQLGNIHDNYSYMLTDMSDSELRLAIAEPAARNGVTFEEDLVDQIICDFRQQAGSLPLLQYTLRKMWETEVDSGRIGDRTLNKSTYQKLEGVTGAFQQQANKVYESLAEEEKQAAKKIFLELVDIADNKPVVRRIKKAEFADGGVIEKTLNILTDNPNRLLVVGNEKSTFEKPTVQVAHEILLTAWPMLQAWIKEAEEPLFLRRRLLEDARRWSRLLRKNPQKAEEELWKESKLRQIQELIKKQIILALNDEANKFLDASMLLAQGIEVHSLLNPQDTQNGLVLAIKAIDENLDKLPEQILAPIQLGLYRAIKISSASISLLGHQALIRSVVFSPDGQMLVSASDDNTLRLWDVSSGKPIGEPLQGHEAAVGSVAFHPNGQMLVSGSADNTLRLWDISGSAIGEPLQGHLGAISSLAFSPDGQMIVSGSADNTLRLWDISGSPIDEPLQGHHAPINSVAFSPDGQMIVSGSSDNTLRLWDISGSPIGEPLQGHQASINSVAFSPDGQIIVSGSSDGTVRLWGIYGNPIAEFFSGDVSNNAPINSVAFSPDGQIILSSCNDNELRLCHISGKCISEPWWVNSPGGLIGPVAFHPGGQMIASGCADSTVRLWDISINSIGQPLRQHEGLVRSVAFSPNGQIIVSGGDDNAVRLWDISGNPIGEPLQGHRAAVRSVAFHPNGEMIVSASADNTLRLWNIFGQPIGEPLQGHLDAVNSVAFHLDGQMLVSASDDNTLRLWNISGQPIGEPLQGHEAAVCSVAFHPNGEMIVSGSADNTLRLWNISGQPIGEPLQAHNARVNSVAFSPDGQMIVSGSNDGIVRLWDISGQQINEFSLKVILEVAVGSVSFSPDGQIIISGCADGTVKLCDISGKKIYEAFWAINGPVHSIAFSPDGQKIASACADGTVWLWPGGWQAWLEICCNRLDYYLDYYREFINRNYSSDIEAACQICQKYVRNSAPADEFNKQGLEKRRQKAFQAAFDDFCRAIQLKLNHTGAYYNRGITCMELKDYWGAIEDFNHLIRLMPNHAAAYEYLGICYIELNNKKSAIENFQKAASLYQQQGIEKKYQDVLIRLEKIQQ
ncbi:MAG: hypothetical protein RMY36_030645 [Nostoc sp. SerVER01]|nr:hypothetical protein [Nostoc sp. SerVER01]